MKKIALVMRDLTHGGAERAICRLSNILSDEYEIYVILFNAERIYYQFSGELIDLKIPLGKSVIQKILVTFKRVIELKRIKRELGIDISISYLESANIINILSKSREKVIVSVRNYKTAQKKLSLIDKIQTLLIKLLYNYSDNIVAVSKVIKNELVDNFSLKEEKIKVIYNPYDIDEIRGTMYEPIDEEIEEFIKNHKSIISVGRIMKQKGFENLIKSIKLMKDTTPNIGLIIVGEFVDKTIKFQLDELIKKYSLEDNVVFTGQKKNPFSYMQGCYCYAMTSFFEGFPNALVEAMACGLPIISVDCKSGPREILYDNPKLDKEAKNIEFADYGILVPEFTRYAEIDQNKFDKEHYLLAEALKIIIESKEKRNYYSKKSIERAKDFDYQRCKVNYNEILIN